MVVVKNIECCYWRLEYFLPLPLSIVSTSSSSAVEMVPLLLSLSLGSRIAAPLIDVLW